MYVRHGRLGHHDYHGGDGGGGTTWGIIWGGDGRWTIPSPTSVNGTTDDGEKDGTINGLPSTLANKDC